ncbi:MAG: SRPBCC family protein [Frankiaceae bacterium]
MTSIPASVRILGAFRRTQDGKGAVRMEDLYDTDIDDLWSALTDPRRLARWIADVDGDLRLGGRIHARFTSSWDGPGRIDVCQAPSRLTVTLSPGAPDETVIDATLVPEQDKTRLVIEESGILLNELPGYGAGWQAHVEDLTAHVEGREAADWHARWSELTPAYRDLAIDPT